MKRLFSAAILFLSANILIFYLGLGRFSGMVGSISHGYHMHFIAFFGLSFLLSLILLHERVYLPAPFTLSFLYSGVMVILLELFQMGTGYRVFSFLDIGAGLIGAGTYSLLGIIATRMKIFEKYWLTYR